jgi:iron complex outermembrane receptor protein
VTLAGDGSPLHNVSVLLSPLGRTTQTDPSGAFIFTNVPPGTYTVVAHLHALTDEKQTITVAAGKEVQVSFALRFSPVRESVTVTASGRVATVMESFQTVTSLEGIDLTTRSSSTSLGELLENETGVAKRSYGPGTSRPVVRGFDGDRVLIMQDGISTGTLSSQSGDHGEPVDSTAVDRVEVIRGPATLLYGSNAIGGVVNVLTGHHILDQHPHDGFHMTLNAVGGTANAQANGSGSFEYGRKDWMLYGTGGAMRSGDYNTPLGRLENSFTDMRNAALGGGRFGAKFAFNLNYGHQEGEYGVPVHPAGDGDEEAHDHEGLVSLKWRRHNARFQGSLKNLGDSFEQLQLGVNYSDWNHNEISGGEVHTQFFNKQAIYRAVLTQKKKGLLTGNFGVQGIRRDYKVAGEEALAPPVKQNGFAAFALEELTLERIRFQFGGRLEHNGYDSALLRDRGFTGASASAGVWIPLWKDGAAVVNYMHSFRAPALEELYNRGPHPGNAVFEAGNADLNSEKGNGVELSLRHQGRRLRVESNLFRYQMSNFVFLSPTGEIENGLPMANYAQAGARYLGAESRVEIGVRPGAWLLLGFDAVDANLTSAGRLNLPRIPPVRGRIGVDWRWKGLSIRPEIAMANRQWQTAPNETPTAGYATVNLSASYTVAGAHLMHMFRVESFNLGDRLYRNHLSFIKDFAPEIGRGVRFGYTLQWY